MTKTQILEEFAQLPVQQQIEVLAAATRILESQFQTLAIDRAEQSARPRLGDAALQLAADYQNDRELTAFTVLDGEDFDASR